MTRFLLLAVVAAFVGLIAFRRELRAWLRDRAREKAGAAEISAWRMRWDAGNPPGPPFGAAEIEEFRAWYDSLALPGVSLECAPEDSVHAGGNRLGGPVQLGPDERWPEDTAGRPLEFVAQLDFAELPPVPDFPQRGLLQFFVGRDDLHGADFEAPLNGAARVLWRPDGAGAQPLTSPPPLGEEEASPFVSLEARARGVALRAGSPRAMSPGFDDWRITERLAGQRRRPGIAAIERILDTDVDSPQRHGVGGHPRLTQYDFRTRDHYGDFDRLLFALTSDDILMWGDMGEAVFLVRRDDLHARDFSRVAFYWDCT